MCLIINKEYHRVFLYHFIPRIAKEDIHVYKRLEGRKLHTPVRGVPVKFTNGILIQTTFWFSFYNVFNPSINKSVNRPIAVYKGIHSYKQKLPDYYSFSSYCFHAIIPKGTLYYVGCGNDMVSLKLITFEKESDYLEYCKKHNKQPVTWESLRKKEMSMDAEQKH